MNLIQPQVDGPLRVSGELEIVAADGRLLSKAAEVWLCRCGHSANKPFCDGSHKAAGFKDAASVPAGYQPKAPEAPPAGEVLRLTLKPNGPLRCLGPMQALDARGDACWTGTQASLCRCGQSKTKPFCDGSHRACGFQSD